MKEETWQICQCFLPPKLNSIYVYVRSQVLLYNWPFSRAKSLFYSYATYVHMYMLNYKSFTIEWENSDNYSTFTYPIDIFASFSTNLNVWNILKFLSQLFINKIIIIIYIRMHITCTNFFSFHRRNSPHRT